MDRGDRRKEGTRRTSREEASRVATGRSGGRRRVTSPRARAVRGRRRRWTGGRGCSGGRGGRRRYPDARSAGEMRGPPQPRTPRASSRPRDRTRGAAPSDRSRGPALGIKSGARSSEDMALGPEGRPRCAVRARRTANRYPCNRDAGVRASAVKSRILGRRPIAERESSVKTRRHLSNFSCSRIKFPREEWMQDSFPPRDVASHTC